MLNIISLNEQEEFYREVVNEIAQLRRISTCLRENVDRINAPNSYEAELHLKVHALDKLAAVLSTEVVHYLHHLQVEIGRRNLANSPREES